jgi:hypothetical protein
MFRIFCRERLNPIHIIAPARVSVRPLAAPTRLVLVATTVCGFMARPTGAGTVYSNDFESNTIGFTNAGVLPALTRTSLPSDAGGLSSPNQSMWLGRLGEGVAKGPASKEVVDLTLTGLTPGAVYTVSFDLLIGASWDGAAVGYGTDAWYFSVDGIRLVDTAFSNGDQGVDYGAYSPQRYSDAHYADPNGPDVPAFTGAEFSRKDGPGYSGYYGIYYFSHGTGNPNLTFTANGTSATLEWARYSGPQNFGDSADEYWALDNVRVDSQAGGVPGDVDGDGHVDVSDLLYLVNAFGTVIGDANYNPACDFNNDGSVDVADLLILVENFGT